MTTDGNRYKKCLAWHNSAGHGHACFEMCQEDQRTACSYQQTEDRKLCSQCHNIRTATVKASFSTPLNPQKYGGLKGAFEEYDKEFCSEACAATYGVGKERLN